MYELTNAWSDENISTVNIPGTLAPEGLSTSQESENLEKWSENFRELESLRSLTDNWDGEGGEAPIPELIESSIDFLVFHSQTGTLPPPSRIVASPIGSIVIEWQLNDKYIEAEILEPYNAEWMISEPGLPTQHLDENWEPPPAIQQENPLLYVCGDYVMA